MNHEHQSLLTSHYFVIAADVGPRKGSSFNRWLAVSEHCSVRWQSSKYWEDR
jgi:hypothetical protein